MEMTRRRKILIGLKDKSELQVLEETAKELRIVA
jgi:hypothetical protein